MALSNPPSHRPGDARPRNSAFAARLALVYTPILLMGGIGWTLAFEYTRRHPGFTFGSTPVLEQAGHHWPAVLALATLCFILGLRHAMDVDHIAAIDNVTRKLANDGQRSVGVGFFFSLGHSVAVLAMASLLVVGELWLKRDFTRYSDRIDEVGSTVCAAVLYALALMNVPVLLGILDSYRRLREGRTSVEQFEAESRLRGFMNRYFGRLYRSVRASWQMFPVGVLFGLGFDTATEMVVLAATANAAASTALPLPMAFVCLSLFFAGMMLLDTSDSVLMLFAYRWAFTDPRRKTLYNLAMTGISVVIAFGIGTVEWLQVAATGLGLKGGVWGWLDGLNLTTLGVGSALLFLALWVLAMLVYRKVDGPSRGEDGPRGVGLQPGA